MGNGSMSDGVYLATQIVTQLLKCKIIKIEFEKHGLSYRLHSGEKLAESPRSGRDEAQQLHRARTDKLFLDPKVNPYAGRVLNKEQLLDTGHFTHRMMRAILPGQRVTDKYGYWWYRADNPDSPRCLQRGLRNDSGRRIIRSPPKLIFLSVPVLTIPIVSSFISEHPVNHRVTAVASKQMR